MMLLRDYTPANELRYLSIADEALREHHWLAFTVHGAPYADKPPLFLWLVMLIRMLPACLQHFAFALTGFVPAVVITESTAQLIAKDEDRRMVFRLMMMTTALMLVSMLTLRMDMLMTMFIVLAVKEFFKLYSGGCPKESWRLPLYIFLAVFTKGGVGFIVPVATILVFLMVKGHTSDFFRYLGWRSWSMMAGLFCLWFLGVYWEAGGDYLYNLTVHQTIGRAFHSFHHRQPFYYYVYMVWPLLFPWSFLTALAAVRVWRSKTLSNDASRLMALGSATTFVSLSLISAKLSIYLLPFVPFAIGMTASCDLNAGRWERVTLAIPSALLALLAPGGWLVSRLSPQTLSFATPMVWLAVALLSLGGLFALVATLKGKQVRSIKTMAVTLLLTAFVAGWACPGINSHIGYRELSDEILRVQADHHGAKVVTVNVKHAQNMDVFLGAIPKKAKPDELLKMNNVVVVTPVKDADALGLYNGQLVGDYLVGYRR
jgi:4-amino-4-deoxy-L-arabinose transferase-like glycosyltransferase